jgi:hypothetical protein
MCKEEGPFSKRHVTFAAQKMAGALSMCQMHIFGILNGTLS